MPVASPGRAMHTGYIGKAHFKTANTFASTRIEGVPQHARSRRTGPGPTWASRHVELMVEGHNTNPPLKPPFAQHYERWYYADGRGD